MRLIIFFILLSFSVQAQFHALLTIKRNDYYQNYLDYIENTLGQPLPPQAVQIAQNNFITALDQAGFMARMKTGYFLHSGSLAGACRVNIKDPTTYLNTVNGTPVFYEGMGTRASSNGYFSNAFKSDNYSGIETDLTVIQGISYWYEYGTQPINSISSGNRPTATTYMGFYPFYTGNLTYYRHASAEFSKASTVNKGLYVLTYDGSNIVMYKDGSKTSNATTPSTPTISTDRYILSLNGATTTGGNTPTTYYDKYVWGDFLFDRFSDADEAAFRAIANAYELAAGIGYGYVMDGASHCWFANPMTAYDATSNKSWIGQVHMNPSAAASFRYRQWIFERNHTTAALSNGFELGTYTQQDDHNEPSILVRASDRRLIAVYAEHAIPGNPIRWRISTNVADATAWGSENTIDPSGSVRGYTYPSTFQVTNGDIYIFYRGTTVSDAKWYFIKSTDNGVTFGAETEFWGHTYTNSYQDPADKDIIHFIGADHPNELTANPKVDHFYFDAGANTWHKTDGTSAGALPVTFGDGTNIITVTNPEGLWFEDLTVDQTGKPRATIIYYHDAVSDGIEKRRYYAEWTGSAWTVFDMGVIMNRNIATPSGEVYYANGSNFDPLNADRLFGGIDVNGRSEMFKIERLGPSSFQYTQLTFNSAYDQWRPVVTAAPNLNVYWLGKIVYTSYTTYNMVLVNKTL